MALHPVASWAIALFLAAVAAQNCYYPNGDLSTGTSRESPCSANGICCPLNWECMSNGLCYDPGADIYGRYSCTDQAWNSDVCANVCTYNYSAGGAEAMLLCPNGKWCCDKNREVGNCCDWNDVIYVDLAVKPREVTSITSLSPLSSVSGTVHHSQVASPSSAGVVESSSTSSSRSPTIKHTTPVTSTHETTTTGANGATSIITEITTIAPSAAADQPGSTSHSSSNLGLIVGLAVGIPLVLIIAAILLFMLYRRKRRNNNYNSIATRPSSPPQMANYNNIPPGTHAPELAGFPVADIRAKEERKSELYGNDRYIYDPTRSPLSPQTANSSPPSYSPGNNRNSTTAQTKHSPMAPIPEQPQELWGGYVPYRPPQNAQLPPPRGDESNLVSPT